jgi:DNA-binding GntR family transcriptional regulator
MPSLAEKAYDAIRADILACELAPGQRTVQSELAEKYQVGTTPIREALHRLAQDGLVEPVPRFGYIVRPVTVRDVRECYEVRGVLEAEAARLAASRGQPELIDRLVAQANFTYVHHKKSSYPEYLSRNLDFHRSVALTAGNRRLAGLISDLLAEMTRVFRLKMDLKDMAQEMREEHMALAEAISSRDASRAEELARDQIARSEERAIEAVLKAEHGLGSVEGWQ